MSYQARYRKNEPELPNFKIPFGEALDPKNELVKMAAIMPWGEIEECCRGLFSSMGRGALPVRVVVGAILLKELRPVGGDRKVVELIAENPYAQYFLGYTEFRVGKPFDASLFSKCRGRLEPVMAQINEIILRAKDRHFAVEKKEISSEDINEQGRKHEEEKVEEKKNHGKLIVDATVAPADIAYPKDCALLFQAIEKCDEVIGNADMPQEVKRPRDNSTKVKSVYLSISKAKRLKKSIRRRKMRLLIDNLGQRLDCIDKCLEQPSVAFAKRHPLYYISVAKQQEVLRKLHEQQDEMLREDKHTIADRIVSISQPWVRPMVRGKSRVKVEFGIKLSASIVDGYIRFDNESFDAYNESGVLITQVETYRTREGFYPQSVHADQVYLTKENREFCAQRDIRLTGKPFGRRASQGWEEFDDQQKQDLKDRIIVESKFGEAKRNYSLDRVMAHLAVTTITVVHTVATVINLKRWLRDLHLFLRLLYKALSPPFVRPFLAYPSQKLAA